jgi:hypothetical protein
MALVGETEGHKTLLVGVEGARWNAVGDMDMRAAPAMMNGAGAAGRRRLETEKTLSPHRRSERRPFPTPSFDDREPEDIVVEAFGGSKIGSLQRHLLQTDSRWNGWHIHHILFRYV